jgi:glycine/D-amino acid oxidase-like deaminating enzyme/nitrite reductase/ring-hydroxylating ferredoxin subunit
MSNGDAPCLTHHSFWAKDVAPRKRFPKLEGVHKTEIAVIGAGITGLTTGIELLKLGHKVTIIEALVIGAGTTGGSTGHLDAHPDMGPRQLLKLLGEEKARLYTDYRLKSIETIKQRCTPECDFQYVSAYQYSENRQHESDIREGFEAAQKIGLSVEWANSIPLPFLTVGYEIKNMARIHPMAYLNALLEMFLQQGGKVFEETIVSGPVEEKGTSLDAGDGRIEFEQVVCAVHCNYTDAFRVYFQTPPYQSYAVAVRVGEQCGDALYWDDNDPYYYIRRAQSDDPHLLIIGGCDHRTGEKDSMGPEECLLDYVKTRFNVEEIVGQWNAELFEPSDGLPIIGLAPGKENVWLATGLSGVGLTWGTAAGKILAEQISGRPTHLEDELSPSRFGLGGIVQMASEQMTTAGNYLERILPADRIDLDDLKPGEGRVGVVDGKFTAACRSREGTIHMRNPRCVHMGGVVHWNSSMQTWDCPVHGGRFTNCGSRLYGPPEGDLVAPDEKAEE